eukprot:jgi/Tetstr1/457265/TSEL_004193.t1
MNNAVFYLRFDHGNFFSKIDSMDDSAKTLLPHCVRIPKIAKPDMLLKYHPTCVEYDGYRPDDIYYYTNTIPHDSSTTCTLMIWITIVKILKSASTGTREIRAGRPLLYALCNKEQPDALKVRRYLDDFKKREEEVDDIVREHGQTTPAEARHTMATNADLNNVEAARVEAEVRAQVLQDDSAFRGVYAGANERLHDNKSPNDAMGSNLVIIDVSDVHEEDKRPETLGDWESRFVIGLVTSLLAAAAAVLSSAIASSAIAAAPCFAADWLATDHADYAALLAVAEAELRTFRCCNVLPKRTEDPLTSQVLEGEGEGEANRIEWEALESMPEQYGGEPADEEAGD